VRLEGSLDAFSLPDIFVLLSMTKKSGALHLTRPGVAGVVHFTAGSITGGCSDLSRQALGRRLAAGGLIDDATLSEAVDRVEADPSLGLARVVQQLSVLDDSVLHEAIGEQITDTVFDMLRWPDGDFAFVVDEANPDDVGVTRGVDEVVADARGRLESWARVSATIPSPAAVVSLALGVQVDASVSRDEWAVLALVDGRRSVAEVCRLGGRGEYAVVSTLAELVERGLVRTDDDEGVAAIARRQSLLSRLESVDPPSAASESAEPAVEPPVSQASRLPADPEPVPESMVESMVESIVEDVTHFESDGRSEVTPTRPEPFLPRRRPEHAEDVPVQIGRRVSAPVSPSAGSPVAAAAGNAAVATAPAAVIERDPGVNKSLLLRLIAGVRGL